MVQAINCFARMLVMVNSLVACVASLTIALHEVLLACQAYCKPSNTTCGQHSEAISTAIACDGYQEGVVRVQRDCFALALCLWQDLASHLLFACGRTLLRTCSASLATSELNKNHQPRVHLFSLSLNQFYFFLNETNTLSFVNLWRLYHSNFSTYLSDLILVNTKQTEKSRLQNENAN